MQYQQDISYQQLQSPNQNTITENQPICLAACGFGQTAQQEQEEYKLLHHTANSTSFPTTACTLKSAATLIIQNGHDGPHQVIEDICEQMQQTNIDVKTQNFNDKTLKFEQQSKNAAAIASDGALRDLQGLQMQNQVRDEKSSTIAMKGDAAQHQLVTAYAQKIKQLVKDKLQILSKQNVSQFQNESSDNLPFQNITNLSNNATLSSLAVSADKKLKDETSAHKQIQDMKQKQKLLDQSQINAIQQQSSNTSLDSFISVMDALENSNTVSHDQASGQGQQSPLTDTLEHRLTDMPSWQGIVSHFKTNNSQANSIHRGHNGMTGTQADGTKQLDYDQKNMNQFNTKVLGALSSEFPQFKNEDSTLTLQQKLIVKLLKDPALIENMMKTWSVQYGLDEAKKLVLNSSLGSESILSMIQQQKQLSMTSNEQEDNTNLDIEFKLDSLIPKEKMPKQKPKRIRTRPGKTPAIQINWTEEEDEELRRLVTKYGESSWHRLCKQMPNKTEIRCFKRWNYLKQHEVKSQLDPIQQLQLKLIGSEPPDVQAQPMVNHNQSSQWTVEEDEILLKRVNQLGTQNWVIIARYLPGRLGRQCRERWHNVLNPKIVRRNWTREEDEFILKMFKDIGSKWSKISKMEPLLGRTVSQIKNRYYQNLKGKDLDKIKYIMDDENELQDTPSKPFIDDEDCLTLSEQSQTTSTKKRDQKQKEKEKQKADLLIYNIINNDNDSSNKVKQPQSQHKLDIVHMPYSEATPLQDNVGSAFKSFSTQQRNSTQQTPQSDLTKRPMPASSLVNSLEAFKNINIMKNNQQNFQVCKPFETLSTSANLSITTQTTLNDNLKQKFGIGRISPQNQKMQILAKLTETLVDSARKQRCQNNNESPQKNLLPPMKPQMQQVQQQTQPNLTAQELLKRLLQ